MENTIVEKSSTRPLNIWTILQWLKLPSGMKLILFAVVPIILAQVIQKLYPIVDNHYITILGTQALLIHNIQFSFISLGQYIGTATATSCLIFWKRTEYLEKQKAVLVMHVALCVISVLFCVGIAGIYTNQIFSHFSVQPEYYALAKVYFHIGLINMSLQAIYLTLMGIIIAANKEKLNLIFSIIFLTINILADSIAIHIIFSGVVSPEHIFPVMLTIILSNCALLTFCIIFMGRLILKHTQGWQIPNVLEIFKIWMNELGGAFISGVYPIIYIFQLGAVKSTGSMLITYQLLLQLTTVFCIPLLATMQIALRDASASGGKWSIASVPRWWQELFYFGLLPTQILLIIFILVPDWAIRLVFGYVVPADHNSFIVLFLLASIIGQIGNALTVPIRARKNSHLVTTSYFIADILVMLGGMQLIIMHHWANPTTTGIVTLVYASIYFLINLCFAFRK